LNSDDYEEKRLRFLAGDLMDLEARIEFSACTGVALKGVEGCRPDESGCKTVTIEEITPECGDCVSNRNSAYEEQFTLQDVYLAFKVQLDEF
jgi:hypothetical protein